MKNCPDQPSWFAYFKENMDALGLPVPTSWHGAATSVTGTLSTLVALAKKMGPRVTIGEVIGAGTAGEGLMVAGSAAASWYLGAAVGSAAVATGIYASCGTRMIDVLSYAARNRLDPPRVREVLATQPVIYDNSKPNRRHFAALALAHAA